MFDNVLTPIKSLDQVVRYQHRIIESTFQTITPGTFFLVMILTFIILNMISEMNLVKFMNLNDSKMTRLMKNKSHKCS